MIDKDLLKNLTDEQKQALLEQLMASLSEPKQEEVAVEEPEEPEETTDNKSDFTMHKNNSKPKGRREAVKFKKNTWQDDGIEFPDVETPKVKRTPRNRKGPQKVSVECHVCGREFQINSSLVYGEYQRCNRCGGK
jgi:DNA-directed RNA polymerase subunit RPC12/RpoP